MHRFRVLLAIALCWAIPGVEANAGPYRLILQGNNMLASVAPDGQLEWQMAWGGIHDVHVLENGHILVQQGQAVVAEIDPETKKVVWSYDAGKRQHAADHRQRA